MATNFWGAAERGFDRGVGFGADMYQRALENARQAREEARQARLDKIAQKNQEQARRLAEELHRRRIVESKVREAQARFEMQLKKDAQAAKQASDETPVPDTIRAAAQDTYGIALPEDVTMGSLGALGIDPEKMMQERGRQRTAAIPRRSIHTTNAGGGSGDAAGEASVPLGDLRGLQELDAVIGDLETRRESLGPEEVGSREDLQKRIDQLRVQRARQMRLSDDRAVEAYTLGEGAPTMDMLPSRDPVQPQTITPPPVSETTPDDDPFDFLDDFDL